MKGITYFENPISGISLTEIQQMIEEAWDRINSYIAYGRQSSLSLSAYLLRPVFHLGAFWSQSEAGMWGEVGREVCACIHGQIKAPVVRKRVPQRQEQG